MRIGIFAAIATALLVLGIAWGAAVYHDCRKAGLPTSMCLFLVVNR